MAQRSGSMAFGRRAGAGAVLVGVLATSAASRAQSSVDRSAAEVLFREGKGLMAKEDFVAACPKLAESQRLDPAPGTLLNLAICHEREGKTASAWTEFNEVLAIARRDKRADRERVSAAAIERLEKVLVRLVVNVHEDARAIAGLEVVRDGARIGAAAWGTAIPVDPGEHTVQARAPGYKPWSKRVAVDAKVPNTIVTVGPLEREPETAPPPPPPAVVAHDPPPASNSRAQALPFVVGGIGVAALGLGAYFGLRANSDWDDVNARCVPSRCTDPSVTSVYDDAQRNATLSNVFFGVGIVGVGVATYLFLRPSPVVRVSAGLSAIRVDGHF